MNKIIGIFDGCFMEYDENTIKEKGLGGSESWIIYISEVFAKIPGVQVIVYCNCKIPHVHKDYPNLIFYPQDYFVANNYNYDALILSRVLSQVIIDKIQNSNCCDNVYLIAHDVALQYVNEYEKTSNILMFKDLENTDFYKTKFKGIFALSKWHKQLLYQEYGYPNYIVDITRYGLNDDLLNTNCDTPRDNNIFWTNSIKRNFDIFVNDIVPKVKEKIPDLNVLFAFHEVPDEKDQKLIDKEYVTNLGSLSKKDLYNEMAKHKCSFYPLIFPETFCMTSVEQAYCETNLVMPLRFGPDTIFEPYKYLFIEDDWNSIENSTQIYVDSIIEGIQSYDNPEKIKLRKSIKNYLIQKYNWLDIGLELYHKIIK